MKETSRSSRGNNLISRFRDIVPIWYTFVILYQKGTLIYSMTGNNAKHVARRQTQLPARFIASNSQARFGAMLHVILSKDQLCLTYLIFYRLLLYSTGYFRFGFFLLAEYHFHPVFDLS